LFLLFSIDSFSSLHFLFHNHALLPGMTSRYAITTTTTFDSIFDTPLAWSSKLRNRSSLFSAFEFHVTLFHSSLACMKTAGVHSGSIAAPVSVLTRSSAMFFSSSSNVFFYHSSSIVEAPGLAIGFPVPPVTSHTRNWYRLIHDIGGSDHSSIASRFDTSTVFYKHNPEPNDPNPRLSFSQFLDPSLVRADLFSVPPCAMRYMVTSYSSEAIPL
jgi:hypothetical protein